MSTLVLKLVLTPALIGTASLAGRRWGLAFAAAFAVALAAQGVSLWALRAARP